MGSGWILTAFGTVGPTRLGLREVGDPFRCPGPEALVQGHGGVHCRDDAIQVDGVIEMSQHSVHAASRDQLIP